MYAFPADTFTIRQKETQKTKSLQAPHLKTSRRTGYAQLVESARSILKKILSRKTKD